MTTVRSSSDCQLCYDRLKDLFNAARSDKIQDILKGLIAQDLTCPGDVLCNADTHWIFNYIAKKVAFSDEEAEHLCNDDVQGACQREWNDETCPSDVEEVIFKHFLQDFDIAHYGDDLDNVYEDLKTKLEELGEDREKWIDD